MLFWLIVLLTIACFFWNVASCGENTIAISGLIFGSVVTFAFLLTIIYIHLCLNGGYIEKQKTRYDMLVYQYENDLYDNDNDVGKYELIRDIREWNEDLSESKKMQRDFWFGILIPNIYDQFDFIQLDKKTK